MSSGFFLSKGMDGNCDMTFVRYWNGLDTIGFCGKYNVTPLELECKAQAIDRPHHIQIVEEYLNEV